MNDRELDKLIRDIMNTEENIPVYLLSKIKKKKRENKLDKTLIIIWLILSWFSIFVEVIFITNYSYNNPLILLILILLVFTLNISSAIILYLLKEEILNYFNNIIKI